MSHTITSELTDEIATVLKERAVAAGLAEEDEARRIFEIGCQATQAYVEWQAGHPVAGNKQGAAHESDDARTMADWLGSFINSEEFKNGYVANLEAVGAIPRRGMR